VGPCSPGTGSAPLIRPSSASRPGTRRRRYRRSLPRARKPGRVPPCRLRPCPGPPVPAQPCPVRPGRGRPVHERPAPPPDGRPRPSHEHVSPRPRFGERTGRRGPARRLGHAPDQPVLPPAVEGRPDDPTSVAAGVGEERGGLGDRSVRLRDQSVELGGRAACRLGRAGRAGGRGFCRRHLAGDRAPDVGGVEAASVRLGLGGGVPDLSQVGVVVAVDHRDPETRARHLGIDEHAVGIDGRERTVVAVDSLVVVPQGDFGTDRDERGEVRGRLRAEALHRLVGVDRLRCVEIEQPNPVHGAVDTNVDRVPVDEVCNRSGVGGHGGHGRHGGDGATADDSEADGGFHEQAEHEISRRKESMMSAVRRAGRTVRYVPSTNSARTPRSRTARSCRNQPATSRAAASRTAGSRVGAGRVVLRVRVRNGA
jgi:hypothetical protein